MQARAREAELLLVNGLIEVHVDVALKVGPHLRLPVVVGWPWNVSSATGGLTQDDRVKVGAPFCFIVGVRICLHPDRALFRFVIRLHPRRDASVFLSLQLVFQTGSSFVV